MRALEKLGDLLSRPEGTWTLGEGALAVARVETPELDERAAKEHLDALGAAVRRRVPAGMHPRFIAPAIAGVLFHTAGLRPAARDEDGPENWCLDQVLARGMGAPIVLAIVFSEVARRAGKRFSPIAMPGKVMLRFDHGRDVLIYDPEDDARVMTPEDCARVAASETGSRAEFREGWLRPLAPPQVLARVLVGLKNCYWRASRHESALDAIRLLLAIRPDDPREIRDSGRVLFTLGRYEEAITAFETYLSLNPHGEDADSVRMLLVEARRGLAP